MKKLVIHYVIYNLVDLTRDIMFNRYYLPILGIKAIIK